MIAQYERRDIRKSVKRFLKQVHGVSLDNMPKKRYKELVNDGIKRFEQYLESERKTELK